MDEPHKERRHTMIVAVSVRPSMGACCPLWVCSACWCCISFLRALRRFCAGPEAAEISFLGRLRASSTFPGCAHSYPAPRLTRTCLQWDGNSGDACLRELTAGFHSQGCLPRSNRPPGLISVLRGSQSPGCQQEAGGPLPLGWWLV